MNKNIMILFLSNVRPDKKNIINWYPYIYTETNKDVNHTFDIEGVQTNEAAVKAVIQSLHKSNKTLSTIYMFCTKTVSVDIKGLNESHKHLFERRIIEFCNNKCNPPVFIPIDYNECSTGDQVFSEVVNLANRIEEDHKSSNITVYADMTGGMRNSSMLMLSIMRLLEYNGKIVEKVLYSNWSPTTGKPYIYITKEDNKIPEVKQNEEKIEPNIIDDVTDIYKLNTLIAGAEEFVKFGSAKVLKDYFKTHLDTNPTSPLTSLLNAMNNFSENLKLCRSRVFDNAIEELKNCIKNYKKANIEGALKSINEKVFFLFMSKIEQQYSLLLKDNRTDLDIILWCIDNDYLQQALTLFVERIPDYIVKNKILYYVDTELDKYVKSSYKKDKDFSKEYILINAKGIKGNESIIDFHKQCLKDSKTKSCMKADDALSIIEAYREIKKIRNNTNHASKKGNLKSSQQIESDLIKYIELLNSHNLGDKSCS